jgi:hypothetical protein
MVEWAMENNKRLQQDYTNETFEARGYCSLCKRLVSRSFPKRVVVSEEEISRIMDQENAILEPAPHVHIYWIDKNFSVRRVEGIRIRDDGLKSQSWIIDEAIRPRQEGKVILLGGNFVSSFNCIGGFLLRNRSTVMEAMPKSIDNSLITMYSPDQDVTVSVLPTSQSNVSNISEWVKIFVKAIANSQSNLDINSVWLAMSYADANAERCPVSVDEKIVELLASSKQFVVTLQSDVKSLIASFSSELGLELSNVEQSFNHRILYDEVEDMIKHVGVRATFRFFFKLFNCRMLRIDQRTDDKTNDPA